MVKNRSIVLAYLVKINPFMLTASATLAIFTMLGLSSLAVFWAKKVGLPHTVFLVVVGVVLGTLAVEGIPGFSLFNEFTLTPELLFYLLLPTLIFESAYNINVRRMVEDTVPILILSVIGLLVSTAAIGFALFYALPIFGIEIPLLVALLFGALISATDPVAVLALFKEFGAPRRLSLIFEGESLFNDATAVALFLVMLDIVLNGFHGVETVTEGVIAFTSMMIGGVIFGLIMGGVFAKLVGATRESEIASITLTIVLAHTTFILAELISHHAHIGGLHLPFSPIIATTIAALVMGNYGRAKIHPRAEEFVEKLWGQLAFMANSLIFILIGVLFVHAPVFDLQMLTVMGITVLIVAIARALSIYPVVEAYNLGASATQQIPRSWQHLLSWGSLRGALAVTMVLLIPADATVPGWTFEMSMRDFLLALTVGCIFATLFIKATTIQSFMRRLKLDTMTEIETVEYQEAKALIHHEVTERLTQYTERGYISSEVAATLRTIHETCYHDACRTVEALSHDTKERLAHRVLRMFAIGIEKRHLKELYHHNEVNESVYRRLMGKLQLQLEAVERGELAPNMSLHTDGKDIFDRLAGSFRALVAPETEREMVENRYMYYRAQAILSRKVLKELGHITEKDARSIFTGAALEHTVSLYTTFREQSQKKLESVAAEHTAIATQLAITLAKRGVHKIEELTLEELRERELITPKLYVTLKDEFAAKEAAH